MPEINRAIQALRQALGDDCVRVGDAIPERNWQDASRLRPTRPAALLLPRSTDEVATALRICNELGQPVTPQGGLTGLAGGAHPGLEEIAISLERMVGIEEIDTTSATLTALAGTPLQVIQDAAEAAGFMCGIDLGARGTCTIGGNVSTNAGGNQVVRYGMTRRNILGLEVVLADGEILRSLNKMMKNNAGYDWTQMFIGAEGTLGVVTRVVVQLHARPQGIQTALCAVDSFADAVTTLRKLERRWSGRLLVFEGMWHELNAVATGPIGLKAPFSFDHELTLLIEAATGDGGPEEFEAGLGELYEEGLLKEAVVAKSRQERNKLWAFREVPYEFHRVAAANIGFDVSIPLDRMTDAIAALRREFTRHVPDDIDVYFGHMADSNIHVNVLSADTGDTHKKAVERVLYDTVATFGGSISAEHGIGRSKRPYLPLSRTAPELALMARVKATLDPKGILNPGRVI